MTARDLKRLPSRAFAVVARFLTRCDNPLVHLNERMNRTSEALTRIEQKIDYAVAGIDFVRKHMANYLGNGVALTFLPDETPIYVNSNDFGPPSNFINGGTYEADNLAVLLSFIRDDTVFLDIGANLGFSRLTLPVVCMGMAKSMRLSRILNLHASCAEAPFSMAFLQWMALMERSSHMSLR